MSIAQNLFELAARLLPDRLPASVTQARIDLGQPLSRVDGAAKVTGAAHFTADHAPADMAHAALVCSTIAAGRIAALDLDGALAAPGVVDILTWRNAPAMDEAPLLMSMKGASFTRQPVMQDDLVRWNGQPLAVVIADTMEQADYAAGLVGVSYETATPQLAFSVAHSHLPEDVLGQPPRLHKGDAASALASAFASVDQTYTTPRHNHAAIELHAVICEWRDGDRLMVFDCSQAVGLTQATLAKVFRLDPDKVRVISHFVGGGFGNKMVWSHQVLCAAAARLVSRPVRMVLSRRDVFQVTGGRTRSEQRLALGASAEGRIQALIHSGITATGMADGFAEQFTFPARHLYASRTYEIEQRIVELNMVSNASMRAPGESIGSFALESAIDELALKLRVDPIALRRLNEPDLDPTKGTAFSARHLLLAYERGARMFGWRQGYQAPRMRKEGEWWIGHGTATATYPYQRFPGAKVALTVSADGQATVRTAAHEMGMGTATVHIQHAAARLGLPVDSVHFEYGDSALPNGVPAGGSAQTASITAALIPAVEKLFAGLQALAGKDSPLAGAAADVLEGRNNGVYIKDSELGESYAAILQRAGKAELTADATAGMPLELMKYSMHSYGAHFCEVAVNEVSGEVRVRRWTAVFDTGRVFNSKTAASQFRGAIIMGIGMALTEASLDDERSGRLMNPSMAEYHVPVHADIPDIEVDWLDQPDPHAPLGGKGIGEIGITGVAATIANAVHNATGKRIRSLPILPDRVLGAPQGAEPGG